jgi:hypothetical protein
MQGELETQAFNATRTGEIEETLLPQAYDELADAFDDFQIFLVNNRRLAPELKADANRVTAVVEQTTSKTRVELLNRAYDAIPQEAQRKRREAFARSV